MGADTKIKICGLTTPEAVAAVNEIRADMAGLVFFPKSPRNVSISDACALAGGLATSVAIILVAAIGVAATPLLLSGEEKQVLLSVAQSRLGRFPLFRFLGAPTATT